MQRPDEAELAEEHDRSWAGKLDYLPFGGFEYLSRLYVKVAPGPDYGAVSAWQKGLPPAWRLRLHDDAIACRRRCAAIADVLAELDVDAGLAENSVDASRAPSSIGAGRSRQARSRPRHAFAGSRSSTRRGRTTSLSSSGSRRPVAISKSASAAGGP